MCHRDHWPFHVGFNHLANVSSPAGSDVGISIGELLLKLHLKDRGYNVPSLVGWQPAPHHVQEQEF